MAVCYRLTVRVEVKFTRVLGHIEILCVSTHTAPRHSSYGTQKRGVGSY